MTLLWTPLSLLLSAIVLVVAAGCSVLAWRRGGCRPAHARLEVFRFFLILLAVLTLNQPEWTRTIAPAQQATLVVLHDVSASMRTRDVIDLQSPMSPATDRLTAAAPLIEPEKWQALAGRMNLVIEPFSSRLPNAERGTDLADALLAAVEHHPQVRRVVVISDGDWNTGAAPGAAASQLRMRDVTVDAVPVGSPERLPDVALSAADAPTYGVVGKSMRIPFRITSWLPEDRDFTLTLSSGAGEPVRQMVRVPGMGQVQDSIAWQPRETGEYTLTLNLPVLERDSIPENNEVSIPLSIREEALKVLLVESFPRWEYRYLRNALERDPGVDVHCLLFHPDTGHPGGGRGYLDAFPSEKELLQYDVVFLGDVGVTSGQLSLQQCAQLKQLVRSQAAGLVFLPGLRGHQLTLRGTELEDLLPVLLDDAHPQGQGSASPGRFVLTDAGRRSLLTRLATDDAENEQVWGALPGFQWQAAALRAKVGTQVLAVSDAPPGNFGRTPLIATRTAGTGKVLFMGTDGAWRWRRGVEDLYHYRFWGQVVRWMAYQRKMSQGESMRLFYSPDRPEADNVLTLHANVVNQAGEPLREGTVIVQALSPTGQSETLRLTPAGDDSWGLFTGTFIPREGGSYRLMTSSPQASGELETVIAVQGKEKEQIGLPARPDVLRELTQITRGELVNPADITSLAQRLADLPAPEPLTLRFRLWSHPLWAGLLVLLLGAFWIARKSAGLM